MRKIREVLRLKFEAKLSTPQIAISVQVGRATISDYLNHFTSSGLTDLALLPVRHRAGAAVVPTSPGSIQRTAAYA